MITNKPFLRRWFVCYNKPMTLIKIISIVVASIYIGWNGAGKWKMSLFETLLVDAIIVSAILF